MSPRKPSKPAKPAPPPSEPVVEGQPRPSRPLPFPVVGIGASAGGIEACNQFLAALPTETGMAFVLVQHLAPSHPSILAEILSRSTTMPVSEVQSETAIQPNHVYVISPNHTMTIRDGKLCLLPAGLVRDRHTIDLFFESLAEQQGHSGIGVVLSGTGTDGTAGIAAIKGQGGIAFAQDDSAQHQGMPRSAIGSGHVDFVLSAAAIAAELGRIATHGYLAGAPVGPAVEIDQPKVSKIMQILHQETGVDFSRYKRNTLYRRITRRMVLHRLESLDQYLGMLHSNPGEVEALYQDILINVTSFFRNPESFEALKTTVFPQLIQDRSRHDAVRIWVVGCSTGQEAYSLAIAFTEFLESAGRTVPVQIFATDVNAAAVDTARAGSYPLAIAQDVSPDRLRRFFVEVDGGYRVAKSIRDLCVFARHNGLADPPFSRIDLVTCRNLLIYLEGPLQQKLLGAIHYALNQRGLLWLGSSETIGASGEYFDVEDPKHKIYRKGAKQPPLGGVIPIGDPRRGSRYADPRAIQNRDAGILGLEAQREADRILLTRYTPPGVLVSAELEILQFRGETGRYLAPAPGKASLSLLKMVREGLLIPVRAAITKAKQHRVSVREPDVRIKGEAGDIALDIEVIPVKGPSAREDSFLIVFDERGFDARTRSGTDGEVAPSRAVSRPSVEENTRLRQDLKATKEYLQAVIEQQEAANEELQSANEEVQSANEELQSINEELETSKEVIQSSNEELATVNDELHNRNRQLGESNNDLLNLLSSVQFSIVMLGPDLRIRRFTPTAERNLNLIVTDVGRPIGDIKLPVELPDLEKDLVEVMATVTPREQDVRDRRGRWYSVRIRPYRTLTNQIDGVVLIFVDIDSLKQAEASLGASEEHLRMLYDQAPFGICETDLDTKVTRCNDEFCRITGLARADLLGRGISALGNRGTSGEVTDLMRQLHAGEIPSYRVEHRYDHADGRVVLVELFGFVVRDASGRARMGVCIAQDITERVRVDSALRESEARFHHLADSAPVPIWVNDANGCEFVNQAYLDFLGVPLDSVVGDGWAAFVHPEDRDEYIEAYRRATKSQTRFEADFRFRRADGEYRWMKSVGVPRRDGGPEQTDLGFVGSSFDITDLKVAADKLRRADRNKNEFLAVLAHELRNPLAPLRNVVHLLRRPGTDSAAIQWAHEVLDRQVANIAGMVDDLLDVSRIAEGKLRLQLEGTDLAVLVRRTVASLRPLLDSRRQRVTLDLPPDPLPVVVDPLRMEQMFSNIINNAVKFTPAGGAIEVRARAVKNGGPAVAEVRIKDDGAGIAPELLPRIFDLFMQGDQAPDRSQGGLGIGLTLVRRLVELHGGQVIAASPGVGRGSEFVIRIPLAPANLVAAPARGSDATPFAPAGPGRVALVVDDNHDAADSLGALLEREGTVVDVAYDGRGALDAIQRRVPDVVFLDLEMPGMTGYQVIERIRRDPKVSGVRVVAVTGLGREEDREHTRAAGFNGHLVKPIDLEALREALRAVPNRAERR